ncbi:YrdB family protein [Metabacillus sp. RGM 3146]|uniref:YrdB family protein n=1 Tax=Metabacillus sp. RGM 3146 TaxID=3401092 RepID=UPI003B9B6DF3
MKLNAWRMSQLTLRFFLELAVLAAFFRWGIFEGQGIAMKIILAAGSALIAAILWGRFAAPKSKRRLKGYNRIGFELFIFTIGASSLFFTAKPVLGGLLLLLFIMNKAFLVTWEKEFEED